MPRHPTSTVTASWTFPTSSHLRVLAAVATFIVVVVALKLVHDYVRPRSEPLVQRYIEVAGRIMALFVGTVSVEMIMQGIRAWAEKF